MSSITQTIPSYNGGISQQPDELKIPGQVKDALNVLPDLTHGLLKRPGGKLIKSLSDGTNNSVANGRWFHYYRDENEQYIGQINRSSGDVNVWRCSDGQEMTVTFDGNTTMQTNLKNYLKHSADEDIQTLTLNDYTYLTNRTVATAMSGTVEPVKPYEAYIELKKVAYASQYSLNVYDSTATTAVYTATRIKVQRDFDSSNACAANGDYPSGGSLPDDGSRCTTGGTADSYCPNVATRVFSVNHGESGDNSDANNTSHTYTVVANGGSAADRKNLYLRITTTGQAVPEGSSTDPDYHCRYTTIHDLLYGGEGWRTGDYVYVWLKDARYKITVESHSVANVAANLALVRPEPTPFDTETTVTAEGILGSIRTSIEDAGNDFEGGNGEIRQIGNGLYLKRNSAPFNINTPVSELLNAFTVKVDDVADLPNQCAHGYVVQIVNSAEDEDDFFVKFFGNNDRDGEGVWEECPEPGRNIEFDATKMPIQMIRQVDGSFLIKQVSWDNCPVGAYDSTTGYGTVPEPSFIGQTINKMLFFRNRMVLLSDENVIMSRPGDFFNYWPKTAINYTATDHVDISCSSEYPAIIYDGIQVNQGLLLFTKNQQFMLTTDSDVLSPNTAKINAVATYNFNYNTNPISLGTTVGFLDNGGKNTRFFEMSNVVREGQPEVIEQSKVVSQLFPKDITLIANSRENSALFFCTKDTNEVFGYRYFSSIQKRMLNAWFRWELSGDVQHMAMLDDALYIVVRNDGKDALQRFSIKQDDSTNVLVNDFGTTTTDDDLTYRLHLDNAVSIPHGDLTYDADKDWTTFTLPTGFNNSLAKLHAIAVPTGADKTFQGMSSPAYVFEGNKVKLNGNWKTYDPQEISDSTTTDDVTPAGNLIFGYLYDMEIKFPTLYYQKAVGDSYRSEIQGSLVLHRLKFSFGPLGVYETKLERVGKPDYIELYEAVIADSYIANRVQFTPDSKATIPVYEKNTNLIITLKSSHPSPATLYSMTWEGDYSNKYYQRV